MGDVVDPFARRRRGRTRALAVGGGLVLGAVALDGVVLLGATALGDRALAAGDHAAASRWYGVTDSVDVVERWVAPYNLGVAAYSAQEWLRAADEFARAAGLAPESAMCRVLINQSASLEALGDALASGGDEDGAAIRYREAESVLARAEGCSDEDGESQEEAAEEGESDDAEPESGDAEQDSESEAESESDAGAEGEGESEGEAEGEGEPGQGSEQSQVEQAAQRLEEKLDDGRAEEPTPAEPSSEEKASELAGRTTGGARVQQEAQDNSAQPGSRPSQSGRTW